MDLNQHKTAFGTVAENYQKYRKGYDPKLYTFLFSLIPPHSKMLDLGCGTGKSTEPLVEKASMVVGVDPDELMLVEARKSAEARNLPIEYIQSYAEKLPFADGSFDAIISGRAFHWFSNDAAMEEMRRILKPNGLLFVFWTWDEESDEDNYVDREIFQKYNWQVVPKKLWSELEVKNLFDTHNFQNTSIEMIPGVEIDTLEESVGLETTSSAFALLSPSDQEKLIQEMTENLQKKLGSRSHFEIKYKTKIVYGMKS